MTNFFLILFLMLTSISLKAKEYRCTINNAPPGKIVAREEVSKYVRQFMAAPKKGAKGKRVDFSGLQVLIWNEDDLTQMAIKDLKSKQQATASFHSDQSNFHLSLSPNAKVECVDKETYSKKKDEAINSVLNEKLSASSKLREFTNRIRFKTNSILRFVYYQKNVNGKMRPIIFQDGKLFTADDEDKRDVNGNWCVFQIQVKLDEDIYMPKGVKLDPLVFQIHSNNDSRDVFSYSFVDFAKGKKAYETYNYALFSLDCSLKKGTELTPFLFNTITGSRFSIEMK